MSKPLFAQLPHQKIKTNLSKPDCEKNVSYNNHTLVFQINFVIVQPQIPWIQLQSLGVKQKDDSLNKNLITAFLFRKYERQLHLQTVKFELAQAGALSGLLILPRPLSELDKAPNVCSLCFAKCLKKLKHTKTHHQQNSLY